MLTEYGNSLSKGLHSNLEKMAEISPDHHFDWVHPDAQTFIFGDDKGDAAAAVSHLRVEVHPFTGRRLGHDVQVNLQRSVKHSAKCARTEIGVACV